MIIYSKKNCPACDALKMKMTQRGVPFEVQVLDVDYDIEFLMDLAITYQKPMPRSFPVVLKEGILYSGQEINTL